jgi:uncharacterized protein (TIGR02246 family)
MTRRPFSLLLLTCGSLPAADDAANPADAGVRTAAEAYVTAFNAHDAAGVAKLWSENGVYVNRETGETSTGRATIEADLNKTFEAYPEIRLQLEAGAVRVVKPDIVHADATATLIIPGEEPRQVLVSGLYVKTGDTWLIDSVEEIPIPAPQSSHDALAPLEWLVGDWQDESDDVTATSSFHWSPNGAFLIRSFSTASGEEPVLEGTQVIGWDPRAEHIRSWTFNSDGSFGEAVWSKSGSDWLIKSTQTLTDGGAAGGTYVVTPVDEDTMSVHLIGHEVNGEAQPSGEPVRVVRVKTAAAEAGPATDATPTPDTTAPKGGAR